MRAKKHPDKQAKQKTQTKRKTKGKALKELLVLSARRGIKRKNLPKRKKQICKRLSVLKGLEGGINKGMKQGHTLFERT